MRWRDFLAVLMMVIGFGAMIVGALFMQSSMMLVAGIALLIAGYFIGWFLCDWADLFDFPP